MRALSSRPFCPYDGRRVSLRDLSAGLRYMYGPTRAVKEVSSEKNTLRDRCSHISGLLVKTSYGLRALMKSALPLLITTAASRALYLIRLEGSRSDLSCHQLEPTRIVRQDSSISLSSKRLRSWRRP